jgi:hypothetical protein
MAKLIYRCTNYGECDKADDREVISLEQGQEPVCPECKRALQSEPSGRGPSGLPKRRLLFVAGALVVVAAAAAFLIFKPAPAEPVTVESCLREVWPWLK